MNPVITVVALWFGTTLTAAAGLLWLANRETLAERMGDLGEEQEEREYEPLTAPAVPEPVRTPQPEREPEQVPA